MTTVATSPMDRWETLPWKHLQRNVFKLQNRIYRASCRDDSANSPQTPTPLDEVAGGPTPWPCGEWPKRIKANAARASMG